MALLVVEDLKKTYGNTIALAGINLSIDAGEFITLLGPSGSGKTTLLMSIAGFTTPTSGRILLDGKDITPLDPEDRDFGLVFQGYALFPHLSVAENVAFSLKVRRWPKEKLSERVREMLDLVDLARLAGRKPRELSGGQQQRVAIARALAFGPRILLLDEPLSALDRELRQAMQRELKRLHRETGVTFVYVTHDQEEAMALSNRIALFNQGTIVEMGSPRNLYQRPSTKFVAGFLGENNLMSGRLSPDGDGILAAFGTTFRLPRHRHVTHDAGAQLTVWVRPEDIRIGAASDDEVGFQATVVECLFVGSLERVVLQMESGEQIVATVPADGANGVTAGQVVPCRISPLAIGILPHSPGLATGDPGQHVAP